MAETKIDYEAINNAPCTRKEQIILAALSTIDFNNCSDLNEVERILRTRVNTFMKFLRPTSSVYRMFDCVRIPAIITKVEFEESSQRYLITYKPDKDPSEEESVRSDRIDSASGPNVKALWENAQGLHAVIYKTQEDTNNPKKPKVRVAPYMRPIH